MKQRLLLLFLLLLIISFYVKGDTINIECPSEVTVNTEFSCAITGNTNSGVNDVKFNIELSDNLKFVTFVNASGFNGDGDADLVSLYSSNTYKGSFKIGTLKLKATSNGSISLNNVFFYLDGKNNVASVSKSIIVSNSSNSNNGNSNSSNNSNNNGNNNNNIVNDKNQNNNNNSNDKSDEVIDVQEEDNDYESYLSDIKIEGYELKFRDDIYEYNITINDEDSLVITPVVSNGDVTYKIFNNKDLKDGSIISIEVRYKEESIQTYYINITKEENKINFVPIFIGIIIALIVFNIVRIFIVKKRNNEENV